MQTKIKAFKIKQSEPTINWYNFGTHLCHCLFKTNPSFKFLCTYQSGRFFLFTGIIDFLCYEIWDLLLHVQMWRSKHDKQKSQPVNWKWDWNMFGILELLSTQYFFSLNLNTIISLADCKWKAIVINFHFKQLKKLQKL